MSSGIARQKSARFSPELGISSRDCSQKARERCGIHQQQRTTGTTSGTGRTSQRCIQCRPWHWYGVNAVTMAAGCGASGIWAWYASRRSNSVCVHPGVRAKVKAGVRAAVRAKAEETGGQGRGQGRGKGRGQGRGKGWGQGARQRHRQCARYHSPTRSSSTAALKQRRVASDRQRHASS